MRVCLLLLSASCLVLSENRFDKALDFILNEADREGSWLTPEEAESFARELVEEEDEIGSQINEEDLFGETQEQQVQDVPKETETQDKTQVNEQAKGLTESDMSVGSDDKSKPEEKTESTQQTNEQTEMTKSESSDDVNSDDVTSDDVSSDDVNTDDVSSDDVSSESVTSDDVTGDEEPREEDENKTEAETDLSEVKRHFSTDDYVPDNVLENWEDKNKYLELKKLLRGSIQLPKGEGYVIDEKTYKFLKSLLRSREEQKPKIQKRDVRAVLQQEESPDQIQELVYELGEEMKELYVEKELAREENALLTEALSYSAMKSLTGDNSYTAQELEHIEEALQVEKELVTREEALKLADEAATESQHRQEEEIRRQEAIADIQQLVHELQEQPLQIPERRSSLSRLGDEDGMCEEVLLLPLGCPVAARERHEFFFNPTVTQLCDRHLSCYSCGEAVDLGPTQCDEGFAYEMLKICADNTQCAKHAVRLLSLVKQGHVYTGDQSNGLCSSRCLQNFIKFGSD